MIPNVGVLLSQDGNGEEPGAQGRNEQGPGSGERRKDVFLAVACVLVGPAFRAHVPGQLCVTHAYVAVISFEFCSN